MKINEDSCLSRKLKEPIAIRSLKRFVADRDTGKWKRFSKKLPPTGKKVAIVGSGPAGLTAGYYLAKRGHSVTVFEALSRAGGMMRFGIPDYRLPKDVLDAEIEEIRDAGVELRLNSRIFSVDSLFQQGYDAVFLALGAQRGMKLGVPGEEDPRVIDGIAFLKRTNLGVKVKVGEKVAVVGGGNTAVDSARAALRLGAKQVRIIYRRSRTEMPAGDEEIKAAMEEGVEMQFLSGPVRMRRRGGKIRITCVRMKLGRADESGRRRPAPVQGSEFSAEYDNVIVSIGQTPDVPKRYSLKTNPDHTVQVDAHTLATHREGVWAGGDLVTGPATVIAAIAAGRKAAVSIDRHLGGSGIIDEKLTRVRRVLTPVVDHFSDRGRASMPGLPRDQRTDRFEETELGLAAADAVEESGRCLQCGGGITSRCRYACPAGINVPLYVHLIREGKYADALAVIREKVPFPGVLGRVCTSPCEEACTGCALCVPYCPMNAIASEGKARTVQIDPDECAECGVCFRANVCPVDALVEEAHPWPRSVRSAFSNPLVVHKDTRVPGRGTEESKTNEVTGQFRKGFIGVTAEMGRPGVGVRFRDVEKVTMALARAKVVFAPNNPVTHLMTNKTTGKLNDDILNEKVCSAMIETTSPIGNLPNVIQELRKAAPKIDSVFSLTFSSRLDEDGTAPCERILEDLNVPLYINGKINIGLGRPLFKEEAK